MKLEDARIINLRELNRIIATAEIDGEYGAAKALKRFKESFKEVGPVVEDAFEAGKESVTTRDSEGFPYWEGTNIDVEEYIKTLEI